MRRFVVALVSLFLALVAQGQTIPTVMRYSASVPESYRGRHVVGMTFAVYADQTGGAALWQETQNVTLDDKGRYSVLLGSTTPGGIQPGVFAAGQARWIGVRVENEAEQSRTLLVAVPYAMKAQDADTLNGMTPEQIAALSARFAKEQVGSVAPLSGAAQTSTATVQSTPLSPQTDFGDTTSTPVVSITQLGTGRAFFATAPANHAIVGDANGSFYGVLGISRGASGVGVRGEALGTSGPTVGVYGYSTGPNGNGIFGYATHPTGPTFGLRGRNDSSSGIGIYGSEESLTGNTVAIYARVLSPNGTAMAVGGAGGRLITATSNSINKFIVEGNGDLFTAGNVTAAGFTGDGSGLTNVNAATLNGFSASAFLKGVSTPVGSGLMSSITSGIATLSLTNACGDGQALLRNAGANLWECSDVMVPGTPIVASAGLSLPATGAAPSTSNNLDLTAAVLNNSAVSSSPTFRWQVVPLASGSANPGGRLDLFYAPDNSTFTRVFSIGKTGVITFAPAQTFPGAVTGATSGGGLLLNGSTLGLVNCSATQTLVFNGSTWGCGTAGGTVTSVDLSAPADFSVTSSAVTTSGTLSFDWVVAPASANTADAIVKRDSSGNFAASTATLTGATVNGDTSVVNTADPGVGNAPVDSPLVKLGGAYNDGAVGQTDAWTVQDKLTGAMTAPDSTLTFTHAGPGAALIDMPAVNVASLTIGGNALNTAFVTTDSTDQSVNGTKTFTSDLHLQGSASSSSTTDAVLGKTQWRLMQNVGDEANAGAFDYRNFDPGALSVVGAGLSSSDRVVRIWDRLTIGYDGSSVDANAAAVFSGRLGVGTSAPATPLHVVGDSTFAGNASAVNNTDPGSGNPPNNSPLLSVRGTFHDGANPQPDTWGISNVLSGSNTSPDSTLTFERTSSSSGSSTISFGSATVTGGAFNGSSFTGDGSGLTALDGGNLSAGSVQNGALANSSVTVTAGTGMAGGGSVSLGSTVTLNNAGVLTATGTANQVLVNGNTSPHSGAVTLTTPQDIGTASTPTFGGATLNGNSAVVTPTAAGPGGGGTPSSSPTLALRGFWWNGSSSQDNWTAQNVMSGTAGTQASTLTFAHSGSTGTATIAGPIFNGTTGFRVNNAAASGNFLRGDGTNFVSSAIQSGDLPATISNDHTFSGNITFSTAITVNGTGVVPASRTISTTAPLTGGGDLSANRTLACATCVTSAASLASNQLVLGGGGQATATLGAAGTTSTVLHGNAAGAPSFAVVTGADFGGQGQNTVFAGPVAGAGNPAFRTLTTGDIPSLAGVYVDLATTQTVGGLKTFSGVITGNLQSATTPASAGVVRLGNTDAINFRNNANSADVVGLTKSTGDVVQVGGASGISTAGVLANYAGVATSGNGLAIIRGTPVDLTAQSAAIASQTLLSSAPAGIYRVSAYLVTTAASGTAGTTVRANVSYTDPDANASITQAASGTLDGSTANVAYSQSFIISVKAGTNITFTTTIPSGAFTGPGRYAVHVMLERL